MTDTDCTTHRAVTAETFTEYAARHGVTPLDPYADIVDAFADYYETTRPYASVEDVAEWSDKAAARWAQ